MKKRSLLKASLMRVESFGFGNGHWKEEKTNILQLSYWSAFFCLFQMLLFFLSSHIRSKILWSKINCFRLFFLYANHFLNPLRMKDIGRRSTIVI